MKLSHWNHAKGERKFFMDITIPKQILYIIQRLEEAGYEAYAVGGCVRDTLLNKEPHDWDVTTSALPKQTVSIFKNEKVIETGLRHGTVTVIKDHLPIEVTTYRIDGLYIDNRRPSNVSFTPYLTEDLARRDFTINAMAYHPVKGLIDLFNGKEDLANKKIRCVGTAAQRFHEDSLRIMRALRFASILNFSIEPATAAALFAEKEQLQNISAERIREELLALLCGTSCSEVLRQYYPILSVWIPELLPMIGFQQHTPYHAYDVWEHTLKTIVASKATKILRCTMLFHDIGKPSTFTQDEKGIGHFYGHGAVSTKLADQIMRRLKFDTKTREQIITLVKYHDIRCENSPLWIKKQLRKFGSDLFLTLLDVHKADIAGQNPALLHRLDDIVQCQRMTLDILNQPSCFSIKDLNINGSDLIALGIPAGKTIGEILKFLLDAVIHQTCENQREALLKYFIKYRDHFESTI